MSSATILPNTLKVIYVICRCLFCCSGSVVKVYSTVSGECMRELKGHKDIVTGVVINPNNKLQVHVFANCVISLTLGRAYPASVHPYVCL